MRLIDLDQEAALRGPPPLTVVVHHDLPAVVVEVAGELDACTAPQLVTTLQAVLRERSPVLILDLSAVQFMASAGISVLLETRERAAPHTALRVVTPGRATLRPLQVTGVDAVLDLYPSRPEALAARQPLRPAP